MGGNTLMQSFKDKDGYSCVYVTVGVDGSVALSSDLHAALSPSEAVRLGTYLINQAYPHTRVDKGR